MLLLPLVLWGAAVVTVYTLALTRLHSTAVPLSQLNAGNVVVYGSTRVIYYSLLTCSAQTDAEKKAAQAQLAVEVRVYPTGVRQPHRYASVDDLEAHFSSMPPNTEPDKVSSAQGTALAGSMRIPCCWAAALASQAPASPHTTIEPASQPSRQHTCSSPLTG
jgi:hypothetical protein